MPFVIILFALILIVVVYQNNQGNLLTALETDVPGFAKWFAAVALVGGLGYVPGMQKPSRWLLALVITVLFLANYKNILAGFQNAAASAGTTTATTDPATALASGTAASAVPATDVTGTSQAATSTGSTSNVGTGAAGNLLASATGATPNVTSTATSAGATTAAAPAPYDPNGLLTAFLTQAGVSTILNTAEMGFGGAA